MFSQQERRTMIQAIRQLPVELERAIAGMTDHELDTPYRTGGWTARQVVHHLADSHINAFVRMKLILTEDHPTLKPYDQDKWATLGDYAGMPVEPSLGMVKGLHARWTALLESLGERDWSRSGFHPEDGEVTLEKLLKTYSAHGERHVRQILSIGRSR